MNLQQVLQDVTEAIEDEDDRMVFMMVVASLQQGGWVDQHLNDANPVALLE